MNTVMTKNLYQEKNLFASCNKHIRTVSFSSHHQNFQQLVDEESGQLEALLLEASKVLKLSFDATMH